MERLYPKLWPKRMTPDDVDTIRPSGIPRTAFITGATGQDGLYLTAYLLFHMREYDYTIFGLVRKNSATIPMLQQFQAYLNTLEIGEKRKLILVYGDVTDSLFMTQTIEKAQPDEIYNLAALSQVQHSFACPEVTMHTNVNGLLNICQAVLHLKILDKVRVFHASTSEMFGDVNKRDGDDTLITEEFPFNPMSPYAVSKVTNFQQVQYYKRVFKMFIVTGITFNHESPLRQETFVTRKISKAVARIKTGLQDKLKLGNIYAMRDWGHAFDYVGAFWLLLNKQQSPNDYIIATKDSVTVKEFAEKAFIEAGYQHVQWVGEGVEEKLLDRADNNKVLIEIDPEFYRPGEVPFLKGSAKKFKTAFNWEPKTKWQETLSEMIEYDLKLAKLEAHSLLLLRDGNL